MSPRADDPPPRRDTELPLPAASVASRSMAAALATIAWFAFGAQTNVTIHRLLMRGFDVVAGLERLTSYLTNLTVLAVAICFTCIAIGAHSRPGRFFRHPPVVTAVVVYMVFVGIAYNTLLRYLWTPSGLRALLNETLHTIIPLLCVLYWLLFVPRFTLVLRDCLLWFVYPLCYLFVTLWRGRATDFYPYPFINVERLGYLHVLVNSLLLLLGFVALMAVFVAINARRPQSRTTPRGSGPTGEDA
ncbi:MAG TPA: Pr6Pr family membrane protein [Paraburkholderia sp.]